MSIANAVVNKYTATHIMGTATLTHKQGAEEVLFVAPMPKDFIRHQAPNLDNEARYYSSPLVAATAFDDLSKDAQTVPAFSGRKLPEMREHLERNYKA